MGLSNEAKESLLQAMDIIANKAASEVAFDSTVKCTIINNDHSEEGYYTVSNGNTKFTAYSENTMYKVNEVVRVSIPNNDFTEKKYIIGRCADEDGSQPITYVSAANSILEVVSFVDDSHVNVGIEANSTSNSIKNISLPTIGQFFEEASENEILNTLFIEIGFQTNLNSIRMASGNYGIRLNIFNKEFQQIGSLVLDSSEFLGNPYAFTTVVKQSKKLSISDIDAIGSLSLQLYQSNNFTYYDGGARVTLATTGQDNIFVKSIKIGFGTDLSQVEDNTVKIFCADGLTYDSSETSREKEISLLWYNKTEDNTYVGFSDGIAYDANNSSIATVDESGVHSYLQDENDYLTDNAVDLKLQAQLTSEVPKDVKSLNFSADCAESATKTKEVFELVSKDLISLLRNFQNRIGSDCLEISSQVTSAINKIQAVQMKDSASSGESDYTITENPISILKNESNKYSIFTQAPSINIYQTRVYEKGEIISEEEYDLIKYLEIVKSHKKQWFAITSSDINVNNYFSTTDEISYVVKKTMRVKIKKNVKINPIEQQAINLLNYGLECQNYNGGVSPEENVEPLFEILTEYSDTYGFIRYTHVKKYLNTIINLINTMSSAIDTQVSDNYDSFSGVWNAQKEKLNEIINKIKSYYLTNTGENKYDVLKLPRNVTLNATEKKVTIKNYQNQNIVYSSTSGWTESDWQSDFDPTKSDNLYNIYWYHYEPDWQSKSEYSDDSELENKIIFKDWKMIPNTFNTGLPLRNNTGKSIQYWNKNSTGENIPKISVTLDSNKIEEKFKVLIVFNHNHYESDELIFKNISAEIDLNLSDDQRIGFQIIHDVNSKDNYQEHYNFTNQLISSSDAQIKRTLKAQFKNTDNVTNDEVFENSWIYWYVPDGATMIKYDTDDLITKGFYTDKKKTIKCIHSPYTHKYTYQMVDAEETFEAGEKIIIESERVINGKKYYCIDSENSYYVLKDSVTLDDTNKIFYPKNSGILYYEECKVPMSFYKNARISKTDKDLYLNADPPIEDGVNFKLDNNGTSGNLDDDYYIVLKDQVGGTCDGVRNRENRIVSDEYCFMADEREEKTLYIQEESGCEKYCKRYFYNSGKTVIRKDSTNSLYILADDVDKDVRGLKIGIINSGSGIDRKKYCYKINKVTTPTIATNSLHVVESKFKDNISGLYFYKIIGEDSFLKAERFEEIEQFYSKDGYFCFYKQIADYNDDGTLNTAGTEQNKKFDYYIKEIFSQDAVNNTIMCAIEGENWTIDETLTTKELLFGTYGANGTEYSIQVTPGREIDSETGNLHTILTVNLYNGSGDQEDFPEPTLSWVGPTSCLIDSIEKDYDGKGYIITLIDRIGESIGEYQTDEDGNYELDDDGQKIPIAHTVNDYYAVLRIEIKLEDVDLESHYPVPYMTNCNYYIDGATSVVYDSIGSSASFCPEPYKIYQAADGAINELSGVTWSIKCIKMLENGKGFGLETTALSDKRYLPTLNNNKTLTPLNLYVGNDDCYATVVCKNSSGTIIWAQPIAILQNRFGSTTLNKWNGKFRIDDSNGTIMGTMFGAGKKNSDNSFSGVLMGDVKTGGDFSISDITTGIYGFHKGSTSFGFNTDGTAFLGKSGKGRIIFDGDYGLIKSALWDGSIGTNGIINHGSKGMAIDLENGHIDAHDFKLTSDHINLESNPSPGGNWMDIGDDNTYLRFSNEGELSIRVTNFELTYHQGENLLLNTMPLEDSGDLLVYESAWIEKNSKSEIGNKDGIIKIEKMVDGSNPPEVETDINGVIQYENAYISYNKGTVFNLDDLKNIVKIKKVSAIGYDNFQIDYTAGLSDDDIYKYKVSGTKGTGESAINYNEDYKDYETVWDVGGLIGTYNDLIDGKSKIKYVNPTNDTYILSNAITDKGKEIGKAKMNACIESCIIDTDNYQCCRAFCSVPNLLRITEHNSYTDLNNDDLSIKVILKSTFNKYFEIVNGSIKLKCNVWIREQDQQTLIDKTENDSFQCENFLAKSFLTTQSKRKCIRVDQAGYTLEQTLKTSIQKGKNYTLSGKVYVNSSNAGSITFSIEAATNEEVASQSISVNNKKGWQDLELHFTDIGKNANIFKINDTTDHGKGTSNNFTLFYHLQLEEGLSATQWSQSSYEKDYGEQKEENSINAAQEYDRSVNNLLETNYIFDQVTDEGRRQGIFTDEGGKLIINAECIGVGLLRSNDVKGTFSYKVVDTGKTGTLSLTQYNTLAREAQEWGYELKITDVNLESGTLFDLRSGIINAAKFELNAWDGDTDEGQGLYLNSNPGGLGSKKAWFLVGDENTHLKLKTDGTLDIRVTNFNLTYHQGENLLVNTAPLENDGEVVAYNKAWFSKNIKNKFDRRDIFKVETTPTCTEYAKGTRATDEILFNIQRIKVARNNINYKNLWSSYNNNDSNIYLYKYITSTTDDGIPVYAISPFVRTHLIGLYLKGNDGEASDAINDYFVKSDGVYTYSRKVKSYVDGDTYETTTGSTTPSPKINNFIKPSFFNQLLDDYNKHLCKKTFYSIPILTTDYYVITKTVFDEFFEYNEDGYIVFKNDTWVRTADEQDLIMNSSTDTTATVEAFLPKAYIDPSTNRKCLQVKKNTYNLYQNLATPLKNGKNYTLSGKIWVNNSTAEEEQDDGTVTKEYKITFKVGNKTEYLYMADIFNASEGIGVGQGWYDFKIHFVNFSGLNSSNQTTFKIEDNTDHNYGSDNATKHTLFYHLKLEEGLCATAWEQSSQEINYSDQSQENAERAADNQIKELNNMLDTNVIFNSLTDDGKKQGLFTDPDTSKLYINAECIGAGLLRSNGVEGKFKYIYRYKSNNAKVNDDIYEENLEDYEIVMQDCEEYNATVSDAAEKRIVEVTDIQLSKGTLFDLRSGIIAAHKFELDAWTGSDASSGSGLYITSNPNLGAQKGWFLIGNNDAYLKFTSDNKLNIKVSEFSLGSGGSIDTYTYETIGKQLTDSYGVASKTFVTGQGYQTADKVKGILSEGQYISNSNKRGFIDTAYIFGQMAEGDLNMYQTKDGKLYINAAAIQAGVIRSKNIEATIIDNTGSSYDITSSNSVFTFEDLVKHKRTIESIELTKGTYFNLDTGSFVSADFNLDIQATNYNFDEDYEYDSSDARMCLRNSAGLDSDETTAKHIISRNGKEKESALATVLYYYDIDKSGDISAGDARLILRKSAKLESLQKTRLTFNDSGLSFTTMVDIDGKKKPEEIFRVDAGGVYIKTLYKDKSGGIRTDYEDNYDVEVADYQRIFSHGESDPSPITTGAGITGSVYFKII